VALAVVVLTVSAFWLRHTGVRTFLPHADERVFLTQMKLLRSGDPHPERTLNWHYYPLLVARIADVTRPATHAKPATVEEHVAAAGADLAHARTLIALLAALGVPAAYALARTFLSSGWSLLAAALFATSPLAISFGQQARPHAALVAPVIVAVLACFRVRRIPVLTSYLLAGLAIGGALAILHNGVVVIPALAMAHLLRDRSRARRSGFGLCAALAVAAFIALATYPSGLHDAESGGEPVAGLSGHRVLLDHFTGRGFANLALALRNYEPWLAPLAVVGLSIWLARRVTAHDLLRVRGREELVVVAAFCVPYALVLGLYDDSAERFLLPLLPCAACAAAYAAASAAGWFASRVGASASAAAWVGTLVLAPQAFLAVRLARVYGAVDTLTLCARWIDANIPPGSARLAVLYTIDLPLVRTAQSLRENPRQRFEVTRPWVVYQTHLPPDTLAGQRYDLVTVPLASPSGVALFDSDLKACIASWHADYAIIQVHAVEGQSRSDSVRAPLRELGTLVARFSPYADPDEVRPFWYQHHPRSYGWWTGNLLRAHALGPVLEVYRMR